MLSRGSQPLPSLAANNSLPALNCLPTSSPPTMISSQPCNQPSEISHPPPCGMELEGENDIKPVSVFSSLPHGGIAMPTLLAQSVSGLKPVPLSALQTTNISHSQEALNLFSSIGVANYTEYTAVDPNEILSQERHIKSEPTTPNINSLNKSPLTLINPNRQFATQVILWIFSSKSDEHLVDNQTLD